MTPTKVAPGGILEGEDYGLKVSIKGRCKNPPGGYFEHRR